MKRKMSIALMVLFLAAAPTTAHAGFLGSTRNLIGYAFFKPVNCVTQLSGQLVNTAKDAGAAVVKDSVGFVQCVVDNLVANPIE